MDVFKYIVWALVSYLFFALALRLIWLMKDRYFQWSWFGEWLLALISCAGVYGVAYHVPLITQHFWWLVFALIVGTSILRLRSENLKSQLKQLTTKQRLLVRCLMVLFTVPLAAGVLVNAANISGIWATN